MAVIWNWKFVSAHNRCHPEPCQHTTPGLRFEFFQLLFSNISATSVDTDAGIVFLTDGDRMAKPKVQALIQDPVMVITPLTGQRSWLACTPICSGSAEVE